MPDAVAPNDFYPARPTDETVERMRKVREGFDALAELITEHGRPSRHLSLAMTALEESSMWAIKCLSHDPVNQKP